uniref:Allorecognition 2 n=1 Tax=Panagrolaimus superbus TaxID=310955 RepID=A0A914YHB0_9BILA
MTIACQPNTSSLSKAEPILQRSETFFNVEFKVNESSLNLLKQSPNGFIPSKAFNVPEIPGLSLQLLFSARPHPGEGQKFVVGLRVNNSSTSKTTTLPINMDYNVTFETANFSKHYQTST